MYQANRSMRGGGAMRRPSSAMGQGGQLRCPAAGRGQSADVMSTLSPLRNHALSSTIGQGAAPRPFIPSGGSQPTMQAANLRNNLGDPAAQFGPDGAYQVMTTSAGTSSAMDGNYQFQSSMGRQSNFANMGPAYGTSYDWANYQSVGGMSQSRALGQTDNLSYSSYSQSGYSSYDQSGSHYGFGTGMAVGADVGVVGGVALTDSANLTDQANFAQNVASDVQYDPSGNYINGDGCGYNDGGDVNNNGYDGNYYNANGSGYDYSDYGGGAACDGADYTCNDFVGDGTGCDICGYDGNDCSGIDPSYS